MTKQRTEGMYKKYFSQLVTYTVVYLFMPIVFYVMIAPVTLLYDFLHDTWPTIFPVYNQVLEKEAYESFTKIFYIAIALIAIFAVNFILSINSNDKYERVIKRTDALFKIPEELPVFLKETALGELIASVFPHAVFLALCLFKYPERLSGYAENFLAYHIIFVDKLGFILSFILIAFVAFSARITAAPFALRKYRGTWLTSFVS